MSTRVRVAIVLMVVVSLPIAAHAQFDGASADRPSSLKSWEENKPLSIAACQKMFEAYQLQAVCMQNERDGYNKLMGDFGMPHADAAKAKDRCAAMFDNLQLQAVCMQNEADGYRQMLRQ